MVYKATLKRRAGIELFQNGKQMAQDPKKACRVVAVKVLKGNLKCRLRNKQRTTTTKKKKNERKTVSDNALTLLHMSMKV